MKNSRAVLVGGLALTMSLALTACGGGDEEAKAAEAISSSMMEENGEEASITQEQADCVGEGFVDKIGVDKLKEYGILNEDLTRGQVEDTTLEEGDAESAADVLVGCVDAQQMLLDQMGQDDSLTAEQTACVGEALDDEALKGMFSLMMQGKDEDAAKELLEPVMSCMM